MKIIPTTNLINLAFNYVMRTSKIYNIDESHALKHSMEVYSYANKIYESEVVKNSHLENQREIICASAILHDMCDKKYMIEKNGLGMIKNYMSDYMTAKNLDTVCDIISTISYSKVKNVGYPNLGEYQLAYHIVREADLLSAYDIDRCIMYGMYMEKLNYDKALQKAINLFDTRVLKYRSDKLFITAYSKNESLKQHKKAKKEIENLKKVFL
jgi:HD superfamily phosphodiesterase